MGLDHRSGLWSFSHAFFGHISNSRKRGHRNQDRPPEPAHTTQLKLILAKFIFAKFILAENTEDAYLVIASRFNSFRSSLVLSISSAAFPTMT